MKHYRIKYLVLKMSKLGQLSISFFNACRTYINLYIIQLVLNSIKYKEAVNDV